jgi:nucleoside-diphosphate kinase
MIKPDGVKRGLTGECIARIERAGLKIVAMKMLLPTKTQADRHYPNEKDDKQWFLDVAAKAKKVYQEKGMKWTFDDMEYARAIKSFLVNYITSGPVVVMVIEGPNAVKMVRKISGDTEPRQAPPGTIRGDYTVDSYDMANALERPLKNIVHASSSKDDAEKETKVWFKEEEIVKFKRAEEDLMFQK